MDLTECSCIEQSRGDLCWQGEFQELGGFDQVYGDFTFRVTRLQCGHCGRRYEVLADDTPAHRVIYQWSANTEP